MRRFFPLMLLATACASDPTQLANEPLPSLETAEVRATGDQTFQLRPNQVAASQDGSLLVTFRSIESDSRCPVDVTCVWAGNAAARIGTATDGGTWSWHVLNSTLEPRQVTVGNHTIHLVSVEPEKRQGVTIRQPDYRVVLRISVP